MTRHVLDVGNCGFDHGAIRGLLEREFDAQVSQAHTADEALAALRNQPFALVLVNRKFDSNHDDGLELIRAVKQDDRLSATPMMLISNYEQYQQQAAALGAVPGFGKSQLRDAQTRENLARFLE